MWNIVEQQASVPNSKIIVFFVTARCTQFFAEFFNSGGIEVMEIHSRKSQSARSKTSERFRNAKQAVLFTSDVSGTGPTHPTPRPISQGSLVVAYGQRAAWTTRMCPSSSRSARRARRSSMSTAPAARCVSACIHWQCCGCAVPLTVRLVVRAGTCRQVGCGPAPAVRLGVVLPARSARPAAQRVGGRQHPAARRARPRARQADGDGAAGHERGCEPRRAGLPGVARLLQRAAAQVRLQPYAARRHRKPVRILHRPGRAAGAAGPDCRQDGPARHPGSARRRQGRRAPRRRLGK